VTRKINCTSTSLVKREQLHTWIASGLAGARLRRSHNRRLVVGFQGRSWTGTIILVRDGGGSVGTLSYRHSVSGRRSGRQSIDISKVSERAIWTIQRIVRVSPAPRFVSSVSWHGASPQALTPRSFRPKHDIDDAEGSAWGSRGLRRYDGKKVSTLLSDFNSLQASVMVWWWRVRVGRSDFQPSRSHVFGRAVIAPTGFRRDGPPPAYRSGRR
jgi:hypothetical protein